MDLLDEAKQGTVICGVFQGGGAKGAAYSGALAAVEEANLRFARVAGASAGALTAATIAAGCTADDIRTEVPKGLRALAEMLDGPNWRKYVRWAQSLRRTGAVFDTNKLETWLRGLFAHQVGSDTPTFADLYAATGIELNIVAANVSQQSQIVFNHVLTPQIDVACAVLASCSIPGAFPPGHLIRATPNHDAPAGFVQAFIDENIGKHPKVRTTDQPGLLRETIVDGGVWANYPLFVFQDTSFRTWAGLEPVTEPVVGFTLDTDTNIAGAAAKLGPEAELAPWNVGIRVKRCEGGYRPAGDLPLALTLPVFAMWAIFLTAAFIDQLRWVGMCLLLVSILVVPAFMTQDRKTELDSPPWQPSLLRNRLYEFVQTMHDGWWGKMLLVMQLVSGLAPIAGMLYLISTRATGVDFAFLAFVGAFLAAAAIGTTLLSITLTACIHYFAPVLMWSGIGLPSTLLAASTEVPPWAGVADDDHVVRVPVALTTLQFELTDDEISRTHHTAHAAVAQQLRSLVPDLGSGLACTT